MLSIGIKVQRIREPQSVVGVHINPGRGWFVCVMGLDGVIIEQFQLDELRIACLIRNKHPHEQARLKACQHTAKERNHHLSDAITAICDQHGAICAVEDISYRRSEPGPQQLQGQDNNSRTVVAHLTYKLPLVELPVPLHIKGVAPRRDCGHCGHRHEQAPIQQGMFQCHACQQHEHIDTNAAQEVCRQGLWLLAGKKPSVSKKARQTDVSETVTL